MKPNKRNAQIATAVVLAAVFTLVVARRGKSTAGTAKEQTPQDAIYAMLDAAREGNVNRYLASYTGQMQGSLKHAAAESPDFGKYLKDSNATIKGVAIQDPQPASEGEVKARVEYVFQDRNEVQFMYLRQTPSGWRIERVDSAERIKTLVPYGTPVR